LIKTRWKSENLEQIGGQTEHKKETYALKTLSKKFYRKAQPRKGEIIWWERGREVVRVSSSANPNCWAKGTEKRRGNPKGGWGANSRFKNTCIVDGEIRKRTKGALP